MAEALEIRLGRIVHLDEFDHHVYGNVRYECGILGCFRYTDGAAVFAMEVVSVGVMYYAALLPCVVASIIASELLRV